MLRAIENGLCRPLDKDSAWWGLNRFRPARDRPYTSRLLLVVCLVYGLPLAALAWGGTYVVADYVRSKNSLVDDTTWLPRGAAWIVFVANTLLNGLACWLWNRRAARLNPAAFRHHGRP